MAIHIEHVQRVYTPEDLLTISREQNELIADISRLEEDKKNAASEFKSQIDSRQSKVTDLSQRFRQGYEIIPTPCDVIMNHPTRGMKTIVDAKSQVEIRTIPMTETDRQSNFWDDLNRPDPEGSPA